MPQEALPLSVEIVNWLLIAVSVVVCGLILRRWQRGSPLLAHEPRRCVPWMGMDLAFILLAFIFFAGAAQQRCCGSTRNRRRPVRRRLTRHPRPIRATSAAHPAPAPAAHPAPAPAAHPAPAPTAHPTTTPAPKTTKVRTPDALDPADLTADMLVRLMLMAVAIGWVTFRVRATPKDLGLDVSHLGSDLRIGAVVFLASVAPITLMQTLLALIQPYDHPLIDAYKHNPDIRMFILTGIAAVLVAPPMEELLFRVLLQGFFEAMEFRRRLIRLAGQALRGPARPDLGNGAAPAAGDGRPGRAAGAAAEFVATDEQLAAAAGPATWPIVASATLFALMHWGQGLAPIPLFFFALALGYVYQRTHRIWPSLAAHMLLNAASFATLWFMVSGPAK